MFWRKKPIEEKAKELARAVWELAKTVAPTLYETLYCFEQAKPSAQRESEQTVSLAMELFYFSLHLLDRECFARHGPDERGRFMDTLITEVWKPLLDAFPDKERIITGRVIIEQANRAQLEYAQFQRLFPAKDQPLSGTLIWEFSKKLCKTYNPSGQERAVIPLNAVALEYVKSLYGLIGSIKL